MNHHRTVKAGGNVGLIGRAKVVAVFELGFQGTGGEAFVEQLRRLVIGEARERRLDIFQRREVAADHTQLVPAGLQHALAR